MLEIAGDYAFSKIASSFPTLSYTDIFLGIMANLIITKPSVYPHIFDPSWTRFLECLTDEAVLRFICDAPMKLRLQEGLLRAVGNSSSEFKGSIIDSIIDLHKDFIVRVMPNQRVPADSLFFRFTQLISFQRATVTRCTGQIDMYFPLFIHKLIDSVFNYQVGGFLDRITDALVEWYSDPNSAHAVDYCISRV